MRSCGIRWVNVAGYLQSWQSCLQKPTPAWMIFKTQSIIAVTVYYCIYVLAVKIWALHRGHATTWLSNAQGCWWQGRCDIALGGIVCTVTHLPTVLHFFRWGHVDTAALFHLDASTCNINKYTITYIYKYVYLLLYTYVCTYLFTQCV